MKLVVSAVLSLSLSLSLSARSPSRLCARGGAVTASPRRARAPGDPRRDRVRRGAVGRLPPRGDRRRRPERPARHRVAAVAGRLEARGPVVEALGRPAVDVGRDPSAAAAVGRRVAAVGRGPRGSGGDRHAARRASDRPARGKDEVAPGHRLHARRDRRRRRDRRARGAAARPRVGAPRQRASRRNERASAAARARRGRGGPRHGCLPARPRESRAGPRPPARGPLLRPRVRARPACRSRARARGAAPRGRPHRRGARGPRGRCCCGRARLRRRRCGGRRLGAAGRRTSSARCAPGSSSRSRRSPTGRCRRSPRCPRPTTDAADRYLVRLDQPKTDAGAAWERGDLAAWDALLADRPAPGWGFWADAQRRAGDRVRVARGAAARSSRRRAATR